MNINQLHNEFLELRNQVKKNTEALQKLNEEVDEAIAEAPSKDNDEVKTNEE